MCDGSIMSRNEQNIIFDGSFEGFLCIIYEYYYEKLTPISINPENWVQESFFGDCHTVKTNGERAFKVAEGIREKAGCNAFDRLFLAFSCGMKDYMAMFSYVLFCFKVGYDVGNYLQLPFVRAIENCARKTGREAHRFLGFVRFKQTTSGVLYSAIEPDNYILIQLAEHFANRLIDEKWIIHDLKRGLCAIYDSRKYTICDVGRDVFLDVSDDDEKYQQLWREFYKTIAVEERVSKDRIGHMLPIKYRKHLTEYEAELTNEKIASSRKSPDSDEVIFAPALRK